MKKVLIILLILLSLSSLLFLRKKTSGPFFQLQTKEIPQINFYQDPLNLTIPTDYDFKKLESLSFEIKSQHEQKVEKTKILNFGKCHPFTDTPDALFNKIKEQPSNKDKGKNAPYQIDCGIIQTSFPLSF